MVKLSPHCSPAIRLRWWGGDTGMAIVSTIVPLSHWLFIGICYIVMSIIRFKIPDSTENHFFHINSLYL